MPQQTKQAMAPKLYSYRDTWIPGEFPIASKLSTLGPHFATTNTYWVNGTLPSLDQFVTHRSFLLGEVIACTTTTVWSG